MSIAEILLSTGDQNARETISERYRALVVISSDDRSASHILDLREQICIRIARVIDRFHLLAYVLFL